MTLQARGQLLGLGLLAVVHSTGCMAVANLRGDWRPFGGTIDNADVAWDVLVKHEKYADETPPIIGVYSLLDLPLSLAVDTATLPIAYVASQGEEEPGSTLGVQPGPTSEGLEQGLDR